MKYLGLGVGGTKVRVPSPLDICGFKVLVTFFNDRKKCFFFLVVQGV